MSYYYFKATFWFYVNATGERLAEISMPRGIRYLYNIDDTISVDDREYVIHNIYRTSPKWDGTVDKTIVSLKPVDDRDEFSGSVDFYVDVWE